jgi:hypothetical protein
MDTGVVSSTYNEINGINTTFGGYLNCGQHDAST